MDALIKEGGVVHLMDVLKWSKRESSDLDGAVEDFANFLSKTTQPLNDLKSFAFSARAIGSRGVSSLVRVIYSGLLNNLEVLDFTETLVNDEALVDLANAIKSAHLPNLRSLSLMFLPCGNKGAVALAEAIQSGQLSALRDLLVGSDFGDRGAVAFSKLLQSGVLNNLEELCLEGHQMSDNGIVALSEALQSSQLTNLKRLDLLGEKIGNAATVALGKALQSTHFKNLQHLKLVFDAGKEGALLLAKSFESNHLINLKQLDYFIGCDETEALLELFRDYFIHNSQRLWISMSVNSGRGNHYGMGAWATMLQSGSGKGIWRVKLSGSSTGDGGRNIAGIVLVGLFESNRLTKIETLNLADNNNIGVAGITAVANFLRSAHVSNLQRLDLCRTGIGNPGAILLADSFKSSPARDLRELLLSGNGITYEGLEALAASFRLGHCGNFEVLDLSKNDLGYGGGKVLAGVLQSGHLKSLQDLSLEQSGIEDTGLKALTKAFRSGHMTKLKFVSLQSTPTRFRSEGIVEIVRAMAAAQRFLPALEKIHLLEMDQKSFDVELSQAAKQALSSAYVTNTFVNAQCTRYELRPRTVTLWKTVTTVTKLLTRKKERAAIAQALEGEEEVAGTHAKVFLCGNPGVGKTTLRHTLMSNWTDVFRNKEQESTRGIEVSHMEDKQSSSTNGPIQLALWDLAGQPEYQVLHSAFLPDLALGDGQAIFFVIVCKASEDDDHLSQQKQMLYWLRFISANSTRDIPEHQRRRVLVLVNCFNNNKSYYDREAWARDLAEFRKNFGGFLNISQDHFVMSAKKLGKVKRLKNRLIDDAQDILKRSLMPKICLSVQGSCKKWAADHKGYPVMRWQSYLNMMGRVWGVSKNVLEAATLYLHQAGHVILFKEGWESPECQSVERQEALVIMDPEWFCHKVVGHALLPEEMLRHGEKSLRSLMEDDGSLPLATLQTADLAVPEEKREELVNILLRLGLCYQLEGEIARGKIFIPALMKDGLPAWCYEVSSTSITSRGRSWVMGYSLVLKGSSWLTTLLPVALFRKLQVDLAQDEDMGHRCDSFYAARGSHITFKSRGMDVLVEYSSDPKDSEKERVDILVKPLVDTSDDLDGDGIAEREGQVNLAQEIVDKMLDIARDCCPGVQLEKRIIRPWSISDGYVPMPARDIKMKVEAMIARMEQHGPQKTNWQVGNMLVREEDLLSEEDLRTLYDLIDKRSSRINVAVDKILIPHTSGILFEKNAEDSQPNGARENSSASLEVEANPQTALILHEMKELGKKMDLLSTDMKGGLRRNLEQQKALLCQVQSLENFSVGLQEKSWPRFAYLAKPGDPHSWIRVKDPFRESFKLNFLCEAPFGGQTLHEVKGQAGVDVKKLKDWARRLAPILDWTLRIAFVAANVASTAILPGLGVFLPSMPKGSIANEIQITQSVVSNLTHYSSEAFSSALKHQTVLDSQVTSLQEGSGNEGGVPATSLTQHKVRGAARDAVNELLQGLNSQEFKKQVGLRRVKLDRYGTSHVVWICHDCFAKHGCPVEV